MEMYGVSQNSLQRYANVINNFSLAVPNAQVYVMLAPTIIEFYGPEKYNTEIALKKRDKIAYDALNSNIKVLMLAQHLECTQMSIFILEQTITGLQGRILCLHGICKDCRSLIQASLIRMKWAG